MFESGPKDAKASQGAAAVLRMVRRTLRDFPNCSSANIMLLAIDEFLAAQLSLESVHILGERLRPIQLLSDKELGKESSGAHFARRAIDSCTQALLSELVANDDVRAWRCVASAAMYVGAQLHIAYHHKNRVKAADVKVRNSPHYAAKQQARIMWEEWQADRSLYPSISAFADHVVGQLSVIESEKTVKNWVTSWRKKRLAQ